MADNHGSTPAAWTAVAIALVAFVLGGIAMVFTPVNWVLFGIAVALLVVAGIVGKVMAAMGIGSDTEHR
jgi:hypothetical protein